MRVKKPFRYSPDGLSSEIMKVGDVRDFHDCTTGLQKAGFIETTEAKETFVERVAVVPDNKVDEDVATEPAKAPAKRRGRKPRSV